MKKSNVNYIPREDCTLEEVKKGKVDSMHGYQDITFHVIFDVNMDFTRKARLVVNVSKTEAPVAMTYPIIVSKDSLRIAFLIEALNYLYVMACDIGNAYLNAPCKENIYLRQAQNAVNTEERLQYWCKLYM